MNKMHYAVYRRLNTVDGYDWAFTSGPFTDLRQAQATAATLERLSRPHEKEHQEDHDRLSRKEYSEQLQVHLKSLEPRKPTEIYDVRPFHGRDEAVIDMHSTVQCKVA